MKFIAKECPKCGAPLKFKVGDRDVHCEHCRMDFAIEYDDGKKEYIPEDFVLSPEHKMISAVAKIMFVIIGLFSIFMIGFTAFSMIKMQTTFEDRTQDIRERYNTNM